MQKDYKEQVVLNETVSQDGMVIMQLTATIDSEQKGKFTYNPMIVNNELYMEHADEMKQIMTEFEDKIKEKEGMMEYEG